MELMSFSAFYRKPHFAIYGGSNEEIFLFDKRKQTLSLFSGIFFLKQKSFFVFLKCFLFRIDRLQISFVFRFVFFEREHDGLPGCR